MTAINGTSFSTGFDVSAFDKKKVDSLNQDYSAAPAPTVGYTGPNIGNILNGSASGQSASNL